MYIYYIDPQINSELYLTLKYHPSHILFIYNYSKRNVLARALIQIIMEIINTYNIYYTGSDIEDGMI